MRDVAIEDWLIDDQENISELTVLMDVEALQPLASITELENKTDSNGYQPHETTGGLPLSKKSLHRHTMAQLPEHSVRIAQLRARLKTETNQDRLNRVTTQRLSKFKSRAGAFSYDSSASERGQLWHQSLFIIAVFSAVLAISAVFS